MSSQTPAEQNNERAVDFVTPFVRSTPEVFRTILNSECILTQACSTNRGHTMKMVTAMIGFSGKLSGSLSLSFPGETAIRILDRILGFKADGVDDFVRDAIGEVTKTVAGKGKRDLSQFDLCLGLPQVIVGEDYSLFSPRWAVHHWLMIESELGPGSLDVGFDSQNGMSY